MLLLLLLLLALGARATQRIPASMHEPVPGRSVPVASLTFGNPPKQLYTMLSGAGGAGLTFAVDPYETSRSVVGRRELVELGGRSVWLPYVVDPVAVGRTNCTNCRAVLSLDRASELWNLVHGAVLGVDGMTYAAPTGAYAACDLGVAGTLCRTPGRVNGVSVGVSFELAAAHTVLPAAMYYAFVGDRRPGSTRLADWPDLTIEVAGVEIRVRPEHLLAHQLSLPERLTIEPGAGPDVVLGHEILYSMRVHFDAVGNGVRIEQANTHRGLSLYATFMIYLSSILFAMAVLSNLVFQPTFTRRVVAHYIVEGATLFFPILAITNPRMYIIWPSAVPMLVFLSIDAMLLLGFGAIGMATMFMRPRYPMLASSKIERAAMRRAATRTAAALSAVVFSMEVRAHFLYAPVVDFIALLGLGYLYAHAATLMTALVMMRKGTDMTPPWVAFVISQIVMLPLLILAFGYYVFWRDINLLLPAGGPQLGMYMAVVVVGFFVFMTSWPVRKHITQSLQPYYEHRKYNQ